MHKLSIDSVDLQIGNRKLLKDVFIEVETNQVVGLLGLNGQGKSQLFEIIYGTKNANYSCIRVDGGNITKGYLKKGVFSYLPQFNFIPKTLTLKRVFEDFNLSFQEFCKWLPEFKESQQTKISKLSGGYKRLVEIYVVVKSEGLFSILDEPFNAIMPLHVENIKQLIQNEKANKGFLITDHNYQTILEMSDLCYYLKDGKTKPIEDFDDLIKNGYILGKTAL